MSTENRAGMISKLVKVAKKHYSPVKPPSNRAVLEHLLYACLLENSDFAAADEAFARLEQYSDWNEVRVSTTQELCEVAAALGDPTSAVERLKLTLHSIFETHYMFELDFLLKENQGKAIAQLEKYKGVTPFVVAYMVQNSFGGHKIPVCEASLAMAEALGLITPKERESGAIPGFERAVPKTKGVEFFSTMHQLAVAFHGAPHDKQVLAKLKEINPGVIKRFEAEGIAEKKAKESKAAEASSTAAKSKKKSPAEGKSVTEPAAGKSAPPAKKSAANVSAKKDSPPAAKPPGPSAAKKSAAAKPAETKSAPPTKSAPSGADSANRGKKAPAAGKSASATKKPR